MTKFKLFRAFFEKKKFTFISDPELIFPNPYQDPNPAKSFGSDRIWIHNTGLNKTGNPASNFTELSEFPTNIWNTKN
jgi:hypothetical protein